jgi:hypothetical protein
MKAKIDLKLLNVAKALPYPYEVFDTELPGFVLRIQPTGIRSYLCCYKLKNGKRGRITIAKATVISPKEARASARLILTEVVKGNDPALMKRRNENLTLQSYLTNTYFPWLTANRRSANKTNGNQLQFRILT